jgi:hypothetical protein
MLSTVDLLDSDSFSESRVKPEGNAEVYMKKLLAIVGAVLGFGSCAYADVEIRMKSGSQCWSY